MPLSQSLGSRQLGKERSQSRTEREREREASDDDDDGEGGGGGEEGNEMRAAAGRDFLRYATTNKWIIGQLKGNKWTNNPAMITTYILKEDFWQLWH